MADKHPQHGDGLGVDTPVGDLGEDDGQDEDQQDPEHQRGHGIVTERARGDHERPEKGHETAKSRLSFEGRVFLVPSP